MADKLVPSRVLAGIRRPHVAVVPSQIKVKDARSIERQQNRLGKKIVVLLLCLGKAEFLMSACSLPSGRTASWKVLCAVKNTSRASPCGRLAGFTCSPDKRLV